MTTPPHHAHPPVAHPTTGWSPATQVVAAGRPARTQGNPLNPPLVFSSTYHSTGTVTPEEFLYTRMDTETWHPFEQALADLEGSPAPAVVFSSGMAAIAAVLALVPAGGRLVVPRHAYQVTLGFAADLHTRLGVDVIKVDIDDTDSVLAACHDADVLLIESPTNPMLEVADLPAVIAGAKQLGVTVAVDNTFATPLLQQPLALGADYVIHSATKYLSGHSDVVLGVVVAADSEARAPIHAYRTLHGAIAGPMEVWLALRGLRTLAVRVREANANALYLAHKLQQHPAIAHVRYPGLPTDPGYTNATATMSNYGAIIAIQPHGDAATADAIIDALTLWTPATSLGGVESTLERRRRFGTESPTVPENLIRMSVGIEDKHDLWNDLNAALTRVVSASHPHEQE